jgi:hypothetical protein
MSIKIECAGPRCEKTTGIYWLGLAQIGESTKVPEIGLAAGWHTQTEGGKGSLGPIERTFCSLNCAGLWAVENHAEALRANCAEPAKDLYGEMTAANEAQKARKD